MSIWKNKKVLVTGAAGFIGSHLVEELLKEGAIVSGTSRQKNAPFLKSTQDKIQLFVGELDDMAFCKKVATNQEIIMHLAAHVGGVKYNDAHHASIFIKNIRPFNNMIEAAHFAHVERFLVTSSACVYPRDCTIPTPEKEAENQSPEPTNAGYGWAKRMQEYLAMEYMKEFGLNVAIARPYNAYGTRDDFNSETSHVIPALIKKVDEAQDEVLMWGDGNATRAFLYVEDFARGLMSCAEYGIGKGPINIGVNEEISIYELLKLIIELFGKNLRIIPDMTKPAGQPRRSCDTSYADEILNFKAKTTLREGLQKTIAWYKNQN